MKQGKTFSDILADKNPSVTLFEEEKNESPAYRHDLRVSVLARRIGEGTLTNFKMKMYEK